MTQTDFSRIEIYLDEDENPVAVYSPPAQMDFDTSTLEDGEHSLKFVATDESNKKSIKKINFIVRNGPGITVEGLKEKDIVEGKVHLLINAFGGAYQEKWRPDRAETPAPIPTWTWIIFIVIIAWGMFYFIDQWKPSDKFADTPTYGDIKPEKINVQKPEKLVSINGAEIYRKSCSSCHQENGRGLPNVFPPLAGDKIVNSNDPEEHIKAVLFGLKDKVIDGTKYTTPMPGWADQLTDDEIAAVINHERSSWGNNSSQTTSELVGKLRNK